MSTIKQKVGQCPECDNGKIIPLISGRCSVHYWRHRQEVNKKKNVVKIEKKRQKSKELNVFFASQLLQVPNSCEECDADLTWLKNSKMRKAIIAHILPKREVGGFPSVATHPQNRMFYCGDCHTNFDNKGEEFVKKMRSLPTIIERFKKFEHFLSESDKQRLPSYLKNI